MDGTPQPPPPPAPLASMCRDRCWKTYCTPHKLESGRIRSGGIFRVVARWRREFAPCSVLFGCSAGVDLVAKDGRRRQPSYSYGPLFPRIRCNRQPTLPISSFVFCCSAIVHMSVPHSETALPPRCEVCG